MLETDRVDVPPSASTQKRTSHPLDLLSIRWLRPVLVNRWPQFLARAIILAGFAFTILVGLLGSPVGSHNFAIIIVWVAWWTALKLGFIPFGGRSWCSICPIPMPGEWLQNGSLLGRTGQRRGLQLRWPRWLRGNWLQAGDFLLIGLFSAVTLTDARVTGWVLLGLFAIATVLGVIFERRSFCSYLCPIGGFTGMYAQAAPVELRVKDISVCQAHAEKTCYQNCAWGVYPAALKTNVSCGLCLECVRACPSDNIRLNLRDFGSDFRLAKKPQDLSEAFLALVMLGSALAFSAVFLGPWGSLKNAAFAIGSLSWLQYAACLLFLNLALLPGLFAWSVWTGQKWSGDKSSLRAAVARQSQMLIPLGLMIWIAFTVAFALPKLSYILSVLSDPLGWGWHLLGSFTWNPDVSSFSPILQVILLLAGLLWSGQIAGRLNRQAEPAGKQWAD
jgi:polyferredoxin